MTDHNFKWRWAYVDQSARTAPYVELLNRLRKDDDPAHFPNTLAWIHAQPGERILEVGCGNGAVARAVARQVPDVSEVVAVDFSAAMIAEAQRLLAGRNLPVSFQVADAHHLPFPDASFDRVYAMEVFVILPQPEQALRELARVLRPGGTLCIWESECDTHVLLADDLALARRLMRFVGDEEYNGAAARQIIGWLKEWGWQLTILPAVSIDEDGSSFQESLLTEWLEDAQQAGVITEKETAAILEEMRRRKQAKTFFSYLVNFRITATRPGE